VRTGFGDLLGGGVLHTAFSSSPSAHFNTGEIPMPVEDIVVRKVFSSQTVAAGGDETTSAYDMGALSGPGYFSLQVEVTGSGTAKFEFLLSNNVSATGGDWIEPSGSLDIATGFTATSGPGSDGKDIFSFSPILARSIKIKCTETGSSDAIVVNAWMAMH
jgi:hypothetical protein